MKSANTLSTLNESIDLFSFGALSEGSGSIDQYLGILLADRQGMAGSFRVVSLGERVGSSEFGWVSEAPPVPCKDYLNFLSMDYYGRVKCSGDPRERSPGCEKCLAYIPLDVVTRRLNLLPGRGREKTTAKNLKLRTDVCSFQHSDDAMSRKPVLERPILPSMLPHTLPENRQKRPILPPILLHETRGRLRGNIGKYHKEPRIYAEPRRRLKTSLLQGKTKHS